MPAREHLAEIVRAMPWMERPRQGGDAQWRDLDPRGQLRHEWPVLISFPWPGKNCPPTSEPSRYTSRPLLFSLFKSSQALRPQRRRVADLWDVTLGEANAEIAARAAPVEHIRR